MKKIKLFKSGAFILFLVILTAFLTLFLNHTFTQTKSISLSHGVLQRFERTGKLQVITFYMDQILDEQEKKYLLWIDQLYPDTKVIISVKSEVSACVDLTKVTEGNIVEADNVITLKLPYPEFCSEPVIDLDSVKRHLESGFGTSDLQIRALQNGQDLAKQQALENKIFELAKDQSEVMIVGLLTEVSEKEIKIEFADAPDIDLEILEIEEEED
ncbi:DUF4230 domain-containing protein [Patescibacteria group bacterium]